VRGPSNVAPRFAQRGDPVSPRLAHEGVTATCSPVRTRHRLPSSNRSAPPPCRDSSVVGTGHSISFLIRRQVRLREPLQGGPLHLCMVRKPWRAHPVGGWRAACASCFGVAIGSPVPNVGIRATYCGMRQRVEKLFSPRVGCRVLDSPGRRFGPVSVSSASLWCPGAVCDPTASGSHPVPVFGIRGGRPQLGLPCAFTAPGLTAASLGPAASVFNENERGNSIN